MNNICIDNTNFQGNVFLQNKFSKLANSNMEKAKSGIEKLIAKKEYNLYIQQDYCYNNINFLASKYTPDIASAYTKISIPVNSKHLKYEEAAKQAIDKYEENLCNKEKIEWDKNRKQQTINDIKDIIESAAFFPLFVINDILRVINPKWGKKFEKLIDKII